MVDIITAAIGAKMASASVQSQIDTALSSVYKYKGQCTNSQLSSKTKTAGDVWEITDSGTYAAGTDVVCDGSSWSAMSGHLHVQVVDSLDSTSATSALSANMGKALADGKQDKLTAGSNIDITNGVISATDTTYTAGTGINISAENVISATGGSSEWVISTSNDKADITNGELAYPTVKKDTLIEVAYTEATGNVISQNIYIPKNKSLFGRNCIINGIINGSNPASSPSYVYICYIYFDGNLIKLATVEIKYSIDANSNEWKIENIKRTTNSPQFKTTYEKTVAGFRIFTKD